MGLAGWEGCSQLQGRATGLSIRNQGWPGAAELGSGLPRNPGQRGAQGPHHVPWSFSFNDCQ